MQASPISAESILEQLGKILSGSLFENAGRSRALLKFVVEQAVNNQGERLKEYTLGAEALGRGESFDPRTDPIVRAEASRLRSRLDRYYATEGRADPVVILVPKGSYVPQFLDRSVVEGGEQSQPPEGTPPGRTTRRAAITWFVVGASITAVAFMIFMRAPRQDVRPTDLPLIQFDVELKAKKLKAPSILKSERT